MTTTCTADGHFWLSRTDGRNQICRICRKVKGTLQYYWRAIGNTDGGLSTLTADTSTVSVMEAVRILRGLPITKDDWEFIRSLTGKEGNVEHIIERYSSRYAVAHVKKYGRGLRRERPLRDTAGIGTHD